MLKDLYFLARVLDQKENEYRLLVNSESINNLPPLVETDSKASIRKVKSDIPLPEGKLIYIYRAKLDTSTKDVLIKNITIIDDVIAQVKSDCVETPLLNKEVMDMVINREVYPCKIPVK